MIQILIGQSFTFIEPKHYHCIYCIVSLIFKVVQKPPRTLEFYCKLNSKPGFFNFLIWALLPCAIGHFTYIANLCLLFSILRKGRLHYIRPVGWSVLPLIFLLLFNRLEQKKTKIRIETGELHCLLCLFYPFLQGKHGQNEPKNHQNQNFAKIAPKSNKFMK